jgi:hypothetical protein
VRIALALLFMLSAVCGGAVVFGLFGLLGQLASLRIVFGALAVCLCLRAGIWHWRRCRRFKLDRYDRQAARNLAGQGIVGQAYFGWILGVTVYTQMVTPLVQALVLQAAALGVPFGLAVGVGLGAARSAAPWRGALTPGRTEPAPVVRRYVYRVTTSRFHAAGATIALALLAADLWLLSHHRF